MKLPKMISYYALSGLDQCAMLMFLLDPHWVFLYWFLFSISAKGLFGLEVAKPSVMYRVTKSGVQLA
jgi:hypothetical protein